MLSITEWHERFSQQAAWTSQLRRYIYDKVSLSSAKSILDVGCGTGILESEFTSDSSINLIGLDIDLHRLKFASNHSRANWLCSNAFSLPFNVGSFDICLCHYLLLWLKDPVEALVEMKRITHPGGYILILAEPDYTHRIDFPEGLSVLGNMQSEALFKQGANPGIGSSVAGLLNDAGMDVIETGLSGGQWRPANYSLDADLEWKTLKNDLSIFPDQDLLKGYEEIDLSARKAGTRIQFLPVFYAIGRIPSDN